MKNGKFFLVGSICLVLGILLTSCTHPKPKPGQDNRKVIVSDLGEVTSDTMYDGGRITYRIYYLNTTREKTTIYVLDKLEDGLFDIKVKNGGKFDMPQNTILWEIPDVEPGHGGLVEFSAKIEGVKEVSNQAVISTKRLPTIGSGRDIFDRLERDRDILTNIVHTTVCGRPEVGWIPFERRAEPGSKPRAAMKDETTSDIMINFEIPGMNVWEIIVNGTLYHRLSIPGVSNLDNIGKPEVPIVGRVVEIPLGVNLSIEIFKSKSRVLDCYNIYPAQIPEIEQARMTRTAAASEEKFALDRLTYLQESFFPVEPAAFEIEDIGIIRGHRVVFLKVNPVQFNPVTKELRIYSQIEVRLNYDRPAQVQTVPKRLYSGPIEEMLRGLIVNYRPHDATLEYGEEWPSEDDEDNEKMGCDYLIITEDTFYNQSDATNAVVEFANWKRTKGYTVRVSKISDVGNTAADIRSYIDNAYHKWNNPPTYVLLLGDANHITPDYRTDHPSWRHDDNAGNPTQVGTDLYYSAVDGTDYFPDLFLGRISVDNAAEADTVLSKILRYEREPTNDANYYTNTSLVRLFEDDTPDPPGAALGDGREDNIWVLIERAEEMRDHLIGEGYTAERIYNRSGNFAQGPRQFEDGSPLPNDLNFDPPTVFNWDGDTNDIVTGVNAGRFLLSFRGHGSRNGWGNPDFHTGDFNLLNNRNEALLVWGPTCQAGWFDDETDHADLNTATDCFAEELLRYNNGGAVAVVAHCRNSWGAANNPATEGMCDAFWPTFDTSLSSVRISRIGQVHNYSKVYMANQLAAGTTREVSFEMQHLFGDPEMPVWTAAPEVFELSYPRTIGSNGEQDFIVTVLNQADHTPVNMAMVTLTRKGSLVARHQTDAYGQARFTFNPHVNDDIELTVTKPDFIPATEIIAVTGSGAEINRMTPVDGAHEQEFEIGGRNFQGSETVELSFGNEPPQSVTAAGGEFGQSGATPVTMKVPAGYVLGPVNITAEGQTSGRHAVDVFTVRTANPIDLFTYCQWDDSTFHLAGGSLTWDNPEIQLYDSGNNAVNSNDLVAGQQYTVKAKIHNTTAYKADHVRVTFQWANFGVGQPDRVWEFIDEDVLDVPETSVVEAEVKWTPLSAGHQCLMVRIDHIEDINGDNNFGQENCDVGPTASPREVNFYIWNPTDTDGYVYLVVRQYLKQGDNDSQPQLWATRIVHPDPQLLRPGTRGKATIILDPAPAKPRPGMYAEFSVTGYIGDKMIGGGNFRVQVK